MTGKPRNSSLFEEAEADTTAATSSSPVTAMRKDAPLAERMRPRTIDEILGQEALLGPGEPLHEALEGGDLFSMILWGPPGSGKTTLANAIRLRMKDAAHFESLSAVLTGVKGCARFSRTPPTAVARRAVAPSSSSTRSIATTSRSRTRCCPRSNRAT